jgi:H+/Cl- antiporter ClcA
MQSIWAKRLLIGILLSFSIGTLASLFLWGLEVIASMHQTMWLYGLPLVGVLFYIVHNSSWAQISTKQFIAYSDSRVSPLATPFILVATWVSHIVGASVGREGTAIMIGGNVSAYLSEKFKVSPEEKSIWLRAGMSAGFAAVFGTPLAGCLFGLEVGKVGKIHWPSFFACAALAFAANFVSLHVWGTKHVLYPLVFLPPISASFWAKLAFIGLFLGLIGLIYTRLESIIFSAYGKLPIQPALKGILAGLILLGLFQISIFSETVGLGSEFLLRPFSDKFDGWEFAPTKLFATALSLGLGFKGGEATPLFLIGSHAAASLSSWINFPVPLLAAIGFTSLYCGLAKTPITALLLGCELFGPQAWFCYLFVTIIVIYFSGKEGLFKVQPWSDYLPKPPYR